MAFIPSLRHYVLLNPTGLIRHAVLAGAAVGATAAGMLFGAASPVANADVGGADSNGQSASSAPQSNGTSTKTAGRVAGPKASARQASFGINAGIQGANNTNSGINT